jgi:hypothetical protein
VLQGVVAQPVLAEQPGDAQRLLQIIQEQQRRLDAQEAQLAEQQAALQALRKAVDALQGGVTVAATPAASSPGTATASPVPEPESTGTTVAGQADSPAGKPSGPGYEGLKQAVTSAREEWPGSFAMQGTDTRMKITGFTELDVVHDSNNVYTPTAFVTQAIQTRGQGKGNGQTSFSVQATRFGIETQTPLEGSTPERPRQVKTVIAADFFNDVGSSNPDLRLREAYGEVSDFQRSGGDLLLGQTWSTYTNLYAIPSTLEFWAPNSIFGARTPMLRWTQPVGDGLALKLAAEAANLRNFELDDADEIDSSDPTVSVENRPRWPDGVVALFWDREPFNLSGGLIARDLRARTDDGHMESAFGWGATLQGRIGMPDPIENDFLQFALTYGQGIGSLFNDYPPDATYDVADNDLEPIDTLGVLVGYQHWWNPQFYSLATYGLLKQDNQDIQLPTAYHETRYTSLNLTWTPDPRWLLGGEVVYGSREDKDGTSGSNIRTVLMGRFNF